MAFIWGMNRKTAAADFLKLPQTNLIYYIDMLSGKLKKKPWNERKCYRFWMEFFGYVLSLGVSIGLILLHTAIEKSDREAAAQGKEESEFSEGKRYLSLFIYALLVQLFNVVIESTSHFIVSKENHKYLN